MERGNHIGINRSLIAEGDVLFQHGQRFYVCRSGGNFLIGEGPQVPEPQQADFLSVGSQRIHGFPDQARNTAERDQDVIRIFRPVAFRKPGILPAEDSREAVFRFRHNLPDFQQPCMLLHLELGVIVRTGGESKIARMLQIQAVIRFKRRQEGIRLLPGRHIHHLIGVRQDKAVQIGHIRGGYFFLFRNVIAQQRQIQRFLRILRVSLNPSAVQEGNGIPLIAVDVPGKGRGPVGVHHQDREAAAGRVGQAFRHIQQTLGRGGGKCPGADR